MLFYKVSRKPSEAVDQESRKKYIRDYRVHQGIQLYADKIEMNPAKRQVSQQLAQSLHNLLHTTLVSDSEQFFYFMFPGH